MSAAALYNNKEGPGKEKSIPEHIIGGSIVVDSLEAFASIIKQFPKHPGLIRVYADLLVRRNLPDLATKSYGEAAELFLGAGNMLAAIVSKKLQWRLHPPASREIMDFVSRLKTGRFDDTPLKIFFDQLSANEILALIDGFVRALLPAGKRVRKPGDLESNLYFVVSGTLRASSYPSLESRQKELNPSRRFLTENDFFGAIYPFQEERRCNMDVETLTRLDLVKMSRKKMIRLVGRYPHIEQRLIELFQIRAGTREREFSHPLRKADRYHLPMEMSLEIYPDPSSRNPLVVGGYSSDISIGGVCAVLNADHGDVQRLMALFRKNEQKSCVRLGLPAEHMEVKVQGKVAWSYPVTFEGRKTLALGIQFDKMSPRLRGMLFMFANSMRNRK